MVRSIGAHWLLTPARRVTTAPDSSYRRSDVPFWTPQALLAYDTLTYMYEKHSYV